MSVVKGKYKINFLDKEYFLLNRKYNTEPVIQLVSLR